MSVRDRDEAAPDEHARSNESFLQRFHRRKTAARAAGAAPSAAADAETPGDARGVAVEAPPPPPTDADMPPLDSLTIDSDYSGFLSERVSEGLRRAALRKLFHSTEFNLVDGLDEYAEDYTTFEALGGILTADMRHQLEVEARRQAEALREALTDGDDADGTVAATRSAAVDDSGQEAPPRPGQPAATVEQRPVEAQATDDRT